MKTKKSNNLYRKARPGLESKVVNRSELAKDGGAKKCKRRKFGKFKGVGILQFSLEGKFIREYSSIREAAKVLKIGYGAIRYCLVGRQKTGGDFQWRYKIDPNFDEGIFDIPPMINHWTLKFQPVVRYTMEGEFVKEYSSLKEAAEICGIPAAMISLCIRGKQHSTKKYQWRFKRDVIKDGKIMDIEPAKRKLGLAVCKFDMYGKFIREYPTMTEAARDERVSPEAISSRIQRKKSGVYQWRFKVDVEKDGEIIDIGPIEKRRYGRKIESGKTGSKYNCPVCQYGLDGIFIREYSSIIEAAEETNIAKNIIFTCAVKKFKSTRGFQWRFKAEVVKKDGKITDIGPAKKMSPFYFQAVCQFERGGKFIREYPSIIKAAEETNIIKYGILSCAVRGAKSFGGFLWRFKKDVVKKGGTIKNIDIKPAIPPDIYRYLRAVCQFEKNGKFIREYPSIRDAANETNAYKESIYKCTQKKMKTAAGFQWRLKEEIVKNDGTISDIEPARKILPHFLPAVCQFGLDGKFIQEYPSIVEAKEKTGIYKHVIILCASKKHKMGYGFQWRYKDDPEFKNGIIDIAPYEKDQIQGKDKEKGT